MKTYLGILLLLSALPIFGQEVNFISKDPFNGKPMLLGLCTREAFKDTSFSWWFDSGYKMYEVDSTSLAKISDKIKNTDITIVMGTWCSDSRTLVPEFYKILDYLNYPSDKVKLINIDRDKKGRDDEIAGLNIRLVPTFIFYHNGKEVGRIVESPAETLEKDLEIILNKE
jgi:thiol-disulfide isomerase/thioredoxin